MRKLLENIGKIISCIVLMLKSIVIIKRKEFNVEEIMEKMSLKEAENELKKMKPIPLEMLEQFAEMDLSLEGLFHLWTRIEGLGVQPEFKTLQSKVIPKIMAKAKTFEDLLNVYSRCVGKPRWLALKAMPSKATNLGEWLDIYGRSHYSDEERVHSEEWHENIKSSKEEIAEDRMIYDIKNEVNKIAYDNIMLLARTKQDWIIILQEGHLYDILRETALDAIAEDDMLLKMWLSILRAVLREDVPTEKIERLKKAGMTFDILLGVYGGFSTHSGGYNGAVVILMTHFAETAEDWFKTFKCTGGMTIFGRFSESFVGNLQAEIIQNMQKLETSVEYWLKICEIPFILQYEKLQEVHKAIFFEEVFKRESTFEQLYFAYDSLYKLEGPHEKQLAKLAELAKTKEHLQILREKCWNDSKLQKRIDAQLANFGK